MEKAGKVRYTMFRVNYREATIERSLRQIKIIKILGGNHGKFIFEKCLQSISERL